jgi:hypothetical protein
MGCKSLFGTYRACIVDSVFLNLLDRVCNIHYVPLDVYFWGGPLKYVFMILFRRTHRIDIQTNASSTLYRPLRMVTELGP